LPAVDVTLVQRWPTLPEHSACALVDRRTHDLTSLQCNCSYYTLDATSLGLSYKTRILRPGVFISTESLDCFSDPDTIEVTAYNSQHSVR